MRSRRLADTMVTSGYEQRSYSHVKCSDKLHRKSKSYLISMSVQLMNNPYSTPKLRHPESSI